MEQIELSSATLSSAREFISRIEAQSESNIKACYQCGKCSAGCPVAFAMDYSPRQIIRLLQLGLKDEALKAHSIWICAQCATCSTRCPRGVEPARLMEAMRIEARKSGITPEKNIKIFDDAFLDSVEKNGRVHEFGLILNFNLKTGQPFKDAGMGPAMMKRGKVSLFPHKIKGQTAIKRIFDRVRAQGGDQH
ncbi:MAG: heterodisulfide reductase subunit C [Firmicutes bacterium]|nr:heterodisulfide reductase subunit C [Bacillota bacterium]